MRRNLAAVLWDMDGTLTDTEQYWLAAYNQVAREHGTAWTSDHEARLTGVNLLTAARYLQAHANVSLDTLEIVAELSRVVERCEEAKLDWCPGAIELLSDVRAHGVACALVTGSPPRCVEQVLRRLPPNTFDAIVTGDRDMPGKPHPAPYLQAAKSLGVRPRDCLAIEDSETGARSAELAGCLVLIVPRHGHPTQSTQRIFRTTLAGLRFRDLLAFVS